MSPDLAVLFVNQWASVHQQAYRIVRDHHLAADVVQEAFLSLWLCREAYRPERGAIGALLRTIVHHRSVDLLRSRSAGPSTYPLEAAELDDLSDQGSGPEDLVSEADQRARVMLAIDALPPANREVLLLNYMHGYTHAEICELLDVPLGTVKTRIRLAKQRLRELLPVRSFVY